MMNVEEGLKKSIYPFESTFSHIFSNSLLNFRFVRKHFDSDQFAQIN